MGGEEVSSCILYLLEKRSHFFAILDIAMH